MPTQLISIYVPENSHQELLGPLAEGWHQALGDLQNLLSLNLHMPDLEHEEEI